MLGHAARRPWSAQQGLHEVEMARAWTARSPARRSVSLHEREIADSSQLTAQSRRATMPGASMFMFPQHVFEVECPWLGRTSSVSCTY